MNNTRVLLFGALILGGCGDDGGGARPDGAVDVGAVTAVIGAAGGTLSSGGVTVTVPPGALATDTELTLRTTGVESSVPLPAGLDALDPLVELLPHGQTFAVPVTITMPLTMGVMASHSSWYLADPDDTTWELFSAVTIEGSSMHLESTHFCIVGTRCSSEVCDDQMDNDGDGLDNCADPDCRGDAACAAAMETNCSDRIDNDGDNNVDCNDTDCAGSCGTLHIAWEVRLDGNRVDSMSDPYTCFEVGGDVIPYTIDGPGPSDISASAVCSSPDGTGTIDVGLVPAGSHTVNLSLRNSNASTTIATGGPVTATVTAGQTTTTPSQVLNVVPTVTPVQVSRIYVNGGDSTLAYARDFVELHNRGNAAFAMTNYSLQVLDMSGGTWHVTDLTGLTIPANGFLLIAYGQSVAQGVAITADRQATNPPDLDSISTGVALVNGTTAITAGQCPSATVDLFGTLGLGTGCYEGTGVMTGSLTDSQILARTNCLDTDNNSADFTIQTIAAPRNSSSSPVVCP